MRADDREASMTAAPIRRTCRTALAGAMALLLAGSCGDDGPTPLDEGDDSAIAVLPPLVVSNPFTPPSTGGGTASLDGLSSASDIVFVSLPPGSVPNGETALVQTRGTDARAMAAVVEGGFDPVPIAAAAGDTLDIRIDLAGGAAPLLLHVVVPPSIPPMIVRTDPPPQKHDVPLNVFMRVVFSEPIDISTLTISSVQLVRDGEPVTGTLQVGDGMHLTATFTPAEPLAPEADYSLVITTEIEDLDGEPLAEEYHAEFTTESAPVTARALRSDGPLTPERNPYYSYRWWVGPDSSSGGCPVSACPARRLTVSRVTVPTGLALEVVDTAGTGFDSVIGGQVPPGAVATVLEWVRPTFEPVLYRMTVELLDGRVGWLEFDTYDPSAAVLPAADLAFVSNRDGSDWIYVANADGSGVTRVVEGSSPAWSWDGKQLAFFREKSSAGPFGIYVMDVRGTESRYVGCCFAPAWSPDGRISFTGVGGWLVGFLGVMNSDGSGVTELYRAGTSGSWLWPGSAAWSPDGHSIAFNYGGTASSTESPAVLIMDADGSDLREVRTLRGSKTPAWSPDGSRIAVIKSSSVITYEVVSASLAVVYTAPPFGAGSDAARVQWSRDGSRLVFDASSHESDARIRRRIFSASLKDGEIRQLIPDAAYPVVTDYNDWGAVWSRGSR